jgi:hypothetical protein
MEAGLATEIDCIIATNLERLVRTAAERDAKFYEKDYEEKYAELKVLANEIVNEIQLEKATNAAVSRVITDLNPAPTPAQTTPNENINIINEQNQPTNQ